MSMISPQTTVRPRAMYRGPGTGSRRQMMKAKIKD